MKRTPGWSTLIEILTLGRTGTGAAVLLVPRSTLPGPSLGRQLRRLAGLSKLGWAFVVVAVTWEVFAFTFSQCVGWGWDRGAFFFAWGLGVLTLGFYLRTTRARPPLSHLFLGVNILVVSILSLVVATR